jgi:hypothetical protein
MEKLQAAPFSLHSVKLLCRSFAFKKESVVPQNTYREFVSHRDDLLASSHLQ